ncbi:hypothetical protein BCR43DRAFT_507271 [Syncephalastrum racemosum]|uniref:Uncharacterized protein n=1 Tax=Syncephalastrum racemosum TaxID=13706 RepID=A0A1X2H6I1_SYNRA|nr:hypothetical protein BCR43DRAFT_507271 [Syncephalastrum racemosum]
MHAVVFDDQLTSTAAETDFPDKISEKCSTIAAKDEEDKPKTSWHQRAIANPYLFSILPLLAGCGVAFQAGTNATMKAYGGRGFCSMLNFITGLSTGVIFFIVDVFFLKTPLPTMSGLKGGSFGTYYIIVNIFTVPKLGAGTVLSIFVCAQNTLAHLG